SAAVEAQGVRRCRAPARRAAAPAVHPRPGRPVSAATTKDILVADIESNETPQNYSTSSPEAVATETAPRPVLNVPGAAVGRRKQAIARVRLIPGSGTITVNGRTLEDYFPNKLHQQLINDPFKVLNLEGAYDVI